MPLAARPTRRPIAVGVALLAVALVGVVVVVLVRGGDPEPDSRYEGAHDGVCSARATAAAGDAPAARRTFANDAHAPLHRLADDAATAGDRASAARLLEAMESVEDALDEPAPQLAGALDALASATASAIEGAEGRAPEPCR